MFKTTPKKNSARYQDALEYCRRMEKSDLTTMDEIKDNLIDILKMM